MEQRMSFLSHSSPTFLKFRLDWLLYCMQLCGNSFYNFNSLFRENHSLLDRATIAETPYIYKSGFLREIRVFSRCAWRNFEEITQSSKRTDTWDDREKSAFPERRDGNILQFRQNWILSLTSCSVTVNFWDSCVFCSKRRRRPLMGRVITPTQLFNNFVISPGNMKIQRN